MTGNQKKISCFLRSFLAFSKIASIAPCKGGLERNLLSRLANPQVVRGGRAKRKFVLFVWQFSIFSGVGNERKMKKYLKIPAYSGLCGVVGNEGNFLQINVHFAFRWFVGIRGRNVSAALAESPPRPSGVSKNSMRFFRRNATNQPRKAG